VQSECEREVAEVVDRPARGCGAVDLHRQIAAADRGISGATVGLRSRCSPPPCGHDPDEATGTHRCTSGSLLVGCFIRCRDRRIGHHQGARPGPG
jgi:hypothetical protein